MVIIGTVYYALDEYQFLKIKSSKSSDVIYT